jgi:hypothetical protein
VFELRTYHATPGKLDELLARFRDHTLALFERHGFGVIGFWTELDAEGATDDTLVYLLAFPDLAGAHQSWAAFRADPDWIAVKAHSEEDGPLTSSIESVFLNPTDFSALR